MGFLAAYSIKSTLLLSALFAIYKMTLGIQKLPELRRLALVCICTASLCMPLLYIYGMYVRPVATNVDLTLPVPTVTISENFTPFMFAVMAGIIAAGICIGAIISLVGLIRIMTLRATTVYHHGHKLKLLEKGQSSPFCFCGNIYISKGDFEQLPEMILTHENSHIRHLHFIDLFIGRLTLILQWWNPIAWMLINEIQLVHEYQADNDVLNAGYENKEYQYLLLGRAAGDTKFGLTSGFKHSELKRRLKMINRERPRRRTAIVLLALIPAFLIAVALPSSPIVCYVNGGFTAVRLNSLRNEPRKDTIKTMDGQPHIILDGDPLPYEDIISVNPQAIKSISVWKDQPEYPYGLIEIETKPGMEIYKTNDLLKPEESDEIKVLGYRAVRKAPIP